MKIAIVSGKDPHVRLDIDGGSVTTRELARGFANKGCLVDIYTPIGYAGTSKMDLKLEAQRGQSDVIFGENGARVFRFSLPEVQTPKYSFKGLEFLNRIAISLAEATYFKDKKLFEYDLVLLIHMAHTFGTVLSGYAPIDRTVVLPMLLGEFYEKFIPVPEAYIRLECEVFSSIKHIQSPSNAEKEVLIGRYGVSPDSVFVVPRGFNPDVITPETRKWSKTTSPKILCTNVLKNAKGQHLFVPTVKELITMGLDPIVDVVGIRENIHSQTYNEYAQNFLSQIKDAGLEKNFAFYDAMPQEKMNELLKSSHIAAFPSVVETFGKAALETMASGLPTIVFDDVPAFQEFIVNMQTGVITKRDPTQLADAIFRLTEDKELYENISKEGIEQGKKFQWSTVMESFVDELRKRIPELNFDRAT